MFSGRYDYVIDEKSRVSIPSKFREILASNYDMRLMLTNLESCIVAYPYKEWEIAEKQVARTPSSTPKHRTFKRLFFSGATEVSIDKLGRILIPQSLKNFAGIKKDVVISGMSTMIEIWARERFEEDLAELTSNPVELGQIISDFGF